MNKVKADKRHTPEIRPLTGFSSKNDIPLDIESALPRFDNDRDFFNEMGKEFRTQLPKYIADIKNAYKKTDAEALRRAAHHLKGTAATFSAKNLAELTQKLESESEQGNLANVERLIASIEREAEIVADYLREIEKA